MRIRRYLAVCALLGAALQATAVIAAETDPVIATVNGAAIRNSDLEDYIQQQSHGQPQSVDRQRVTDELITRELVYQDAVAQGLEKTPEFAAEMETYKRDLMLNLALRKELSRHPV